MPDPEDARFAELRALESGWDSYGADPLQPGVEERARAIIALLRERPRIFPTTEGGIQLAWGNTEELSIEIEPGAVGKTMAYIEDQDMFPTSLHEWRCPSCGATTRAQMAAQPVRDEEGSAG